VLERILVSEYGVVLYGTPCDLLFTGSGPLACDQGIARVTYWHALA